MDRRGFMATGLAAGAAAVSAASSAKAMQEGGSSSSSGKFKLKYAPHFNMFKNSAGKDPIDQLKFAADQGFTAWEDNGMMNKPKDLQERIAKTMEKLGIPGTRQTLETQTTIGNRSVSQFTPLSEPLVERCCLG